MTSRNGWTRVRRDRPCPICERPDWCLLAADGGAAICTRVESSKKCGDAGWLHRLRDDARQPARRFVRSIPLTTTSSFDFAALSRQFQEAAAPIALDHLARQLGLSVASLHALGIGWNGWAWSFPMTNVARDVLGIRLRRPDGGKLSVKGGKEGLFLPTLAGTDSRLLICEGPSDTASLLDMGFVNVAGRPSCLGGIKLLVELVRERKPDQVIVVADGDEPGRRGAESLASILAVYVPAVRVVAPPDGIKDARAWLRAGATRNDLEAMIDAASERRLTMRTRKVR